MTNCINQQGKCPVCGSENLDYGSYALDEFVEFPWKCGDCGASGKERYELIFVENCAAAGNGAVDKQAFAKVVKVPDALYDRMDDLVSTEPLCEEDCFGENEPPLCVTADFENGYFMDIKVCGVQYMEGQSNTAFSEAVLFNGDGVQLECTEPCDFIEGTWTLEADNKKFSVELVPESSRPKKGEEK